ncbi:hypothetical protein MKW92_043114 [Papaver armeniacum]|nr:hypothetical protein MKW92_043114 [Papaver armeniacum]
MASAAASSSSKQQIVLCGPNYVRVYKTTTAAAAAEKSTEASTKGLQSEAAASDEKMEVDRPDFMLKEEERPPYVVVVHGPPKVGKSTLIRSLAEHYSKKNRVSVHKEGPIMIISGAKRRIQFVECPNSVSGMLDAAKYADAVILLIDTYTSFEMETFEFVNILRVHGMPMVMGVLTSLDLCTNAGRLSRTKEYLTNHFRTEIYEGARLFCLSGLEDGRCKEHEILHLANFIWNMEFYPLSRDGQPYVLVDHFEDVTPVPSLDKDKKCNRNIVLYGYLRGCDIKNGVQVHIAGVGDLPLFSVTSLADPYPLLAGPKKKRSRKDKEHDASEGFKPGTYLKLEVRNVPFKMVENYDPHHLILVGGISPEEKTVDISPEDKTVDISPEDKTVLQATLMRHSWHMKLLRTSNPVIVSIGWRRYQTFPVYAVEDGSERLRMLHYTPIGTQCLARFRGPQASPALELYLYRAVFRILATAAIVNFNDDVKIFWKHERAWYEVEASRIFNPLASTSKPIEEENLEVTESDDEEENLEVTESDDEEEGKASGSEQEVSESGHVEEEEAYESEHEGSESEGEEEAYKSEGEEEAYESEDKNSHLGRRQKLKGLRTVRFFEGGPDFDDRISARNLLCFDNKDERKAFANHPLLVISKDEKLLEIQERSERMKNCLQDFLKQRQQVLSKEEEMLILYEREERKEKSRQEMRRRGLKAEFDGVGV